MKAKAKYCHKMEKAFLMDEINAKEEHPWILRRHKMRLWKDLFNMVKPVDRIRFSACISKISSPSSMTTYRD